MISTYLLTWKLFWASWNKDWATQERTIAQLGTHFVRNDSSMVTTLMWNVITFTLLQAGLIYLADFSADFSLFCLFWVHLPCLFGSVAFYYYKYGATECFKRLSFSSLLIWLKNWIAMQGIALVCLTQTTTFYFLGHIIQPYVLPKSWQFSVRFPTEMYEEYLQICVYFSAGLFALCLVTLPLWKRGYKVSMESAGRKNINISYTELFMELMYQAAQSGGFNFTMIPLALALQNMAGYRVNCIHFLFGAAEIVLANSSVQYKFCIMHQLMHEVKPLYAMTHVEHHICKSIHPTSSATGLWENWMMGQSPFIVSPIGLGPIPWSMLQMVYAGANIVVHTMWPSQYLLQWHTLHHTILSDVYNVNIPSPYDMEHSKSVAKLQDKLKEASLFIRYEALSDIAAFALIGVGALIFHYGFGIGASRVDWSRADWVFVE
mmetsp:Transcript_36161/g.66342  ORF Transcript_36161/g.66342 Transcript_36161/m.66342 type:complete len:433 (+) Transcript_36161:169-1467(+)